ncbi:alpha/beta hydrolase [Sphingomonas echinoides]|jgi:dienelactone hydrolase|uniref:Alpha/beta hydrolase n=1 Tax=Sphingomonas echinoides TaxID=59803 RepID=A0ABU4PQ85_9SPHN|nr:alpha/beta hydrolase [Sphingomonas echinoides]MDX5984974.1 alpha/beta hydrolase [Sphingomonas echinoides]
MMHRLLPIAMLLTACSAPQADTTASAFEAPAQAVTLTAADGKRVFGRLFRAEHPKATILLFHQAGSSKDEYRTIAPRLVAAGYSALAIDQRAGGTLYGPNETSAQYPHPATYLEAVPDLQAAIDWATQQHAPVILWGSSYSAALVFVVGASNRQKITAILSFSPGEYFDDKQLIKRAAAQLSVPAYITAAPSDEETAAAKSIADAMPSRLVTRYIPKQGVHGSSTLIRAKDPKGAEDNWLPVLAFLRKVAP